MKHLITILLIVILAAACRQQKVNFKGEEEKITFAWTDWSKKAATGKPELIAYYFADDAIVIAPKIPLMQSVNGKADIIKMYASAPTNFEMDMKWENENKPNIVEFSKDGDMAYCLDRNEISVPDSTGKIQMIPNKVLHIWKKDKEGITYCGRVNFLNKRFFH